MGANGSGNLSCPRISIVFPYYDNPEMLRFQLETMSAYSPEILARCEIVVVDDGSPSFPASEVILASPFREVRVFRLLEDKPWNQDAARNIGAFEAEGQYLLLTDIDHIVPEQTLSALYEVDDEDRVYVFSRKAHFSEKIVPSHVNSYFMSRVLYWQIGGYDEDFWGAYGSDRLFRQRLLQSNNVIELSDIRLELVTRGAIVDAKNVTLSRQPSVFRRIRSLLLRVMKFMKFRASPVTLVNAYERIL